MDKENYQKIPIYHLRKCPKCGGIMINKMSHITEQEKLPDVYKCISCGYDHTDNS